MVIIAATIFIAVFATILNNSTSLDTRSGSGQLRTYSPEPTKNWETYSNPIFGFSLKYPPDLVLSAFGDDFGNTGYIKFKRDGDEYMTINLSDSFNQASVGSFMEARPVSKKMISGESWNYYNFFYQDGQVESLNYNVIAYEIVKDDFLYTIVFENQTKLTDEQEIILSSFRFSSQDDLSRENGCIISGCNGEICANKEMFSTCEYRPEHECYNNAECQVQSDGECGWVMDEELITCIGGSI